MHSISPETGNMLSDEDIITKYKSGNFWGMTTSVDLCECNPDKIRSADEIRRFAIELCDLIDMKRFGEPVVVRFGSKPQVEGYSLAQLIETSLISGHFAEESDSAYIDIFSCKEYGPHKAAKFCSDFFGASGVSLSVTFRPAYCRA